MTTMALFASAPAASAVLIGFIRRWAVRKAILDLAGSALWLNQSGLSHAAVASIYIVLAAAGAAAAIVVVAR